MNKLIAAALIIVLNFIVSQFLPWWNFIPVVMIVVALFRLKAKASWLIPAFSLLLLWLVQIFLLDSKTGHRSSARIADIFDAPGIAAYLIPIIGVAFLGGLSGYISYLFRTGFQKNNTLQKANMSIDDYKDTQPDLQDKGIV